MAIIKDKQFQGTAISSGQKYSTVNDNLKYIWLIDWLQNLNFKWSVNHEGSDLKWTSDKNGSSGTEIIMRIHAQNECARQT